MKVLGNENLNELIKEGTYLVDFYAEWCGPCKMLAPVLEKVADKINIIKVNVDIREDLSNEYRIMSVPTLIFFKNGVKVKEISGFHTEEQLVKEIVEIK